MKIASRTYKPSDFSGGQPHEMLVTLGKFGFSPEMANLVQNAKSGKAREIVGLFSKVPGEPPLDWWLRYWEMFYRGFFKYNLDASGLLIPERRKGFGRMLVMAEPAISQPLFDKSKEYFPCRKVYGASLDEAVPKHERDPRKGPYVIWVEDLEEPSERLKNVSADRVREMNLTTETLPERLVHGFVYHLETGRQLDAINATYCTGSCVSGGLVPYLVWYGGGLYVSRFPPSFALDDLRPREVVS